VSEGGLPFAFWHPSISRALRIEFKEAVYHITSKEKRKGMYVSESSGNRAPRGESFKRHAG